MLLPIPWLLGALLAPQDCGGGLVGPWVWMGGADGERFGAAVAGTGDLDGDGFGDLLVGAPETTVGLWPDAGRVEVWSGRTSTRLFRREGAAAGELFGAALAGGLDLDGNAIPDFVVGVPGASPGGRTGAGELRLYGGGGRILRTLPGTAAFDGLGASLAAVPDLDGDGRSEILAGAPAADPSGRLEAGSAFLYSGVSGLLLARWDGVDPGGHLGAAVSCAGDADGDGVADVLLGAPDALSSRGVVVLVSGRTGGLLGSWRGRLPGARFGAAVAGPGDVDGDGRGDLLVGAPGDPGRARVEGGAAALLSGASGKPVWSIGGGIDRERLGASVAGPGDVDGDGIPDLAAGAPGRPAGAGGGVPGGWTVWSGATLRPIYTVPGWNDGEGLGETLAAAGDLDADGLPDVVAGAPLGGPLPLFRPGRAHAVAFHPWLFASTASLDATAGGRVDFLLAFPELEAGAPYVLLTSASGAGPTGAGGLCIPLTPDGVTRRVLLAPPPWYQDSTGSLDATGAARAVLDAPPGALAPLAGGALTFCALVLGADGRTPRLASVARRVRVE